MASKELQAIIDDFRSRPMLGELPIEEQRTVMETGFAQFPLAPDVECKPVDAAGVPAEFVTTPESVKERVIYYLHGGGYVVGTISSHREMASRLARAAKARVLLIAYRLAPEHPFPAAVEDSRSSENKSIIIVMIYVLSFLMVSTIKYLSFKEFNIRHRKPFNVLVSIILICIVIAYKPRIILFFIMLSYILSGPVITLYRLHGRRSQTKEPVSVTGDEMQEHEATDQGRVERIDTT